MLAKRVFEVTFLKKAILLHIMRGYQCYKAVNKNDTREVI